MLNKFSYSFAASFIFFALIKNSCAEDKFSDVGLGIDNRVKFDPIFLSTESNDKIDISRFELGASASPGIYPTDIYVNDEFVSRDDVKFVEHADKQVMPCLTPEVLRKINFDYSQLPGSFTKTLHSELSCYPLPQLISQAKILFDSGTQRLDISIPQAMMQKVARGYVSPELWDSGLSALMLGYTANAFSTRSGGESTNSAYVGLNAGLNVGAWYFRHDGSYNWQEKVGGDYQSINNYVQRDIPMIKGRILIGETSTNGQLFDTVPFKGAELVSDDRMLPQSQRGYAPDIRGIARTNARVTIRQNGRVIYETTVPPGAFVIDDLYPTGYGGNLDVTVAEADGTSQNFLVPYASVTQLLRPGAQRFGMVVGKLNDLSIDSDPGLFQATYQRGINNSITGYGGVQTSSNYYALQLGAAVGTPIGAFSADVTQSRVHLESTEKRVNEGQSYQLSYSKFIPESNSNLTIATYRYSTEGYFDYLTAMRALDAEKHGQTAKDIWRPRNRFNVTLNQGLYSGWGQVYLTGYSQDYWNHDGSDLQYQLGYSNNYQNVSFSISAGRVRSMYGSMETNWLFSLTMPLGNMMNSNIPTLAANLNHNSDGRTGEQVGVSGTAGKDSEYSYGVTGMNYNKGTGSSIAMNGAHRSQYTNITAAYGEGKDYKNASVGLSGTAIAWSDGVVLTPYTGDTFAVVEAKGASGAKVGGYSGIQIDPWGHAAVPYLNPYEMNEITIDPKDLPDDIQLDNTSSKIAPYFGAVSKVVFSSQRGTPLLITATSERGDALPFGAEIFDSAGNSVGYVGQMRQLYARVNQNEGVLMVKWGETSEQQCHVRYHVPESNNGQASTSSLIHLNAECQ